MAADQGLIQASLTEAKSRKGIDKTKFYQAELDIISKTTTGVLDFIYKKEKAKEDGFNSISKNIEEMLRKLAGSSEQLGGMQKANVQKLKDLKQEYLSAYGNSDKEKEIMFKIEQVTSEINGLAAGFGKYGDAYTSGSISIKDSNPSFYKIFEQIWDKDGDYGNLQFKWNNNNKLEVSVDSGGYQSVTDLFDGVELKDDTPRIGLGELGNNTSKFAFAEQNINKSFEDVKKESIEVVNSLMSTPGKFSNLITSSFKGEISFKDALATMFDDDEANDNKEMVAILKNLGLDANIKNKTVLFEALTDIHSKNFDYDTAKNLATEFYMEGYVKSKFNDGRTALNNNITARNNENNKGGTYTIGKQSVSKQAIDYSINLLNSNKDFTSLQAWNGTLYKRENGKYYLKDEVKKDGKTVYKEDGSTPKIDWVVKTKDQVASAIGVLRPDLGYKSAASSTSTSTSTSTPATPLFDVETIVSKINKISFNQDAKTVSDQIKPLFVNIPGVKVESTERDGVIIKYKGKQVEVPAKKITNYTSDEDKDALAISKSTLEEWLRTVSIKPVIK